MSELPAPTTRHWQTEAGLEALFSELAFVRCQCALDGGCSRIVSGLGQLGEPPSRCIPCATGNCSHCYTSGFAVERARTELAATRQAIVAYFRSPRPPVLAAALLAAAVRGLGEGSA